MGLGDGKTAAIDLLPLLPEGILKSGRVGHGEAGPIEHPSGAVVPQAIGIFLSIEFFAHGIGEPVEDRQWQTRARFDAGRGRELQTGQMPQRTRRCRSESGLFVKSSG